VLVDYFMGVIGLDFGDWTEEASRGSGSTLKSRDIKNKRQH